MRIVFQSWLICFLYLFESIEKHLKLRFPVVFLFIHIWGMPIEMLFDILQSFIANSSSDKIFYFIFHLIFVCTSFFFFFYFYSVSFLWFIYAVAFAVVWFVAYIHIMYKLCMFCQLNILSFRCNHVGQLNSIYL